MFFLLFLLLDVSFGLEPQSSRWPCGMNQCSCSLNLDHQTRDGMLITGIDVTCLIKTLTSYKSALTSLPFNLTTLSITCSDGNSSSYLKENLFTRYRGMDTLSVESCNIKRIDPNFALGLDELSTLRFHRVTFPPFNPNTFSTCRSLTSLTITESKMNNFPYFRDIKGLETLHISKNNMETPEIVIPGNGNIMMARLIDVDFSYNGIGVLPPTFFSFIPNLKYINLKGNKIDDLSVPRDYTLRHLESFDASENPIKFIDFDAFTSSKNLTTFRITGSDDSYIPLNGVIDLPNLVNLTFSNFKLNNSIWELLRVPSLIVLNLSFNSIDTVIVNTFPLLQKLRVQHNIISQLPASAFANTPDLLLLNLSLNALTQIPKSIFNSNPNLKAVDMKINKIVSLDSNLFRSTPDIFYLDLSHNRIPRLPFSLFSPLSNLLFLYLQGNELTFLPKLSNLQQLNYLDVSHNFLRYFSAHTFKGLVSLQFLTASSNRLVTLPHGLLTSCPSLIDANFDHNQIKSLGSFEGHPRLIRLRLENNSLTDFVTQTPFQGMKSLAYVFLDDNNFTSITPNMFPPTVEFISLTHNSIFTLLRQSLVNLPRLSLLNLMRSKTELHVPQVSVQMYTPDARKPTILLGFTQLVCNCRLGYLKVWDQGRHNIPVLIQRFPKFSGLENAACTTSFFPDHPRPFRDTPLSQFVCPYNDTMCFVAICDCCGIDWDSCPCSLTCPSECSCYHGGSGFDRIYAHIVCSGRNLSYVPGRIPAMATHVYLDGNVLTTLSRDRFSNLTHAEELSLNSSGIVSIEDGAFDNMRRLDRLLLNDNRIRTIGDLTFGNITSLTHLDLSHNQITHVQTGSFDDLINLHTLHLHNNQLVTLHDILHLSSLRSVTLAFNPWSCDCDLIENLSTVVVRMGNIIQDKNIVCCQIESENLNEHLLFLQNMTSSSSQFIDYLQPNTSTVSVSRQPESLTNDAGQARGDNSKSSIPIERNETSPQMKPRTGQELLPFADQTHTFLELPPVVFDDLNGNNNMSCLPVVKFNFGRICSQVVTNYTTILVPLSSSYVADVTPTVIVVLTVAATVLLVTTVVIIIVLWRRNEVQALLFAKTGVRIWDQKVVISKKA